MLNRVWSWLSREKVPAPAKETGIGCMGIESKEQLRRTLDHITRIEAERKGATAAAEATREPPPP